MMHSSDLMVTVHDHLLVEPLIGNFSGIPPAGLTGQLGPPPGQGAAADPSVVSGVP